MPDPALLPRPAAESCPSRSYYVCPLPECKWSGSSRSRHAKSRRDCSAVPIAFRYQPGADVGEMVRVALNSQEVLTSASQEAAAATGATQPRNPPPKAPPAYRPAAQRLAAPRVRPAAATVPPIASATAVPDRRMPKALEEAEEQSSRKKARTYEGPADEQAAAAAASAATATAEANAAAAAAAVAAALTMSTTTEAAALPTHASTHALLHAAAVPTGVPDPAQVRMVPMGVPEAPIAAPAGVAPAGVPNSPAEAPPQEPPHGLVPQVFSKPGPPAAPPTTVT